ncbi:MAG TPA: H4MPT-linked C1 transfer pathway protein [Methylophaga aminisulfidivorans]|uniref:H4MPT-linked C1 transfer pathway protein n=1 Tax=Methylophaga aminisulfidivorans TaxID=230105 RepID=A0A7C2ABY7_9GAMM|nr:H4MPT-linked C1 transfer pathway protein [Methylophaga aminisulfidivorans]
MTDSNSTLFCGWDIGGAHIKLAIADKDATLLDVKQVPCALWKGIEQLELSLDEILASLTGKSFVHFVTMTGELVDAFADREAGVNAIIDCVESRFKQPIHYFAGNGQYLNADMAKRQWTDVASMNWQASASFAAKQIQQGLFVDIGSTTCDIIAINNHQTLSSGNTDYARQRSGELVYTGAIRTPLMQIAEEAPLHGERIPLSAEWFACSADVWLLLNKITAESIQDHSPDGKPWDKTHSTMRLARMLACDIRDASEQQWLNVAMFFAEKQLQRITQACYQVLSRHNDWAPNSPLIGAGFGRFIIEQCAQRLGRPYVDLSSLFNENEEAAAHAPCAALAILAAEELS